MVWLKELQMQPQNFIVLVVLCLGFISVSFKCSEKRTNTWQITTPKYIQHMAP